MPLVGRMAQTKKDQRTEEVKKLINELNTGKTAPKLVGRMANIAEQKKEEPAKKSGLLEFAKNIPTYVARTVSQPVEFIEKLGSTLGAKAAETKVGKKIGGKLTSFLGISKKDAEQYKKGLERPITLPKQSTPLIASPTPFKSVREGVGSGVEAAVNIGTAFLGGGAGRQVVKEGAAKLTGRMLAKNALKDATVGGIYGATSSMQDENATGKDIAKSAAIGAGLGAILPPVAGAAIKITGKSAGIVGKGIGKGLEKSATKLEAIAGKPAVKATAKHFYENIDKPVQTVGQKIAGKTASIIRGAQKTPAKLTEAFIDKFDSIRRFQNKAKQAGIDTTDLHDMAQSAKYVAAGKAENKLDDYLTLRGQYKDEWHNIKAYSHYLDDLDRLGNGNKIAGDRTTEQVLKDLNTLKSSLTPEQIAKVEEGHKNLQAFLNDELKGALESGRLSEQGYNAIKEAHPNYIPHNVLDFLDDEAGKGLGGSFNMAKSGIEKAKGSTRAIDDIDNAIVDRLYRQNLLNEKNKTVSAIIDTGTKLGDNSGFTPLRTEENVNKRISAFTKLKEQFKEQRKTYRSLNTTVRTEKKIFKKIGSNTKEMESLIDEAQTLSSEFHPKSEINSLIEKAATRERKIFQLEAEVQTGKNAVAKKELEKLIAERKQFISQVKAEISAAKDIKIKGVDIPKGFEKISRFNNGVKEDWLIPEDVGKALKHINSDEANVVMNWLNNSVAGKIVTAPAKAVRKLATGVNPVFSLFSNPARDIQTVQMTAKAGPIDLANGLIKAITKGKGDDDLYRLARESGALQGSIFRENMKPEQILQDKLSKGNIFSKIVRLDKIIENAGQTMEEMTRLAVFKRALKDGKTAQEAAKIARNATVDFGKSGYVTQVLNKVVPFLNARVQGFVNLGTALKNDPTKFVRQGMWTAAYPAAVLYGHNSKFESYQSIPDNEKRKYWIIMIGQGEGEDYKGKKALIPHYIKIPKGEAQQAISNTMDRVLNAGEEKYPDTTKEFLAKMIGDISPVTESSILPAGLGQAVETMTNYSLYRQKSIDPEYVKQGDKFFKSSEVEPKYRYSQSTSEIAKYLGQALNWSPSKIDYVIKTGVLNDIVRSVDLTKKGFKNEDGAGFEKAAELPGLRSILGTSNYGTTEKEKKIEKQKTIDKNTQKIEKQINNPAGKLTGRMAN